MRTYLCLTVQNVCPALMKMCVRHPHFRIFTAPTYKEESDCHSHLTSISRHTAVVQKLIHFADIELHGTLIESRGTRSHSFLSSVKNSIDRSPKSDFFFVLFWLLLDWWKDFMKYEKRKKIKFLQDRGGFNGIQIQYLNVRYQWPAASLRHDKQQLT